MTKLRDRRITQHTVNGLAVGDTDAVFWDSELQGFGVRVYPSGAKVYVVQTRGRGKSVRVSLGRHGLITADEARRKPVRAIINIKEGERPERSPADKVTVAEPSFRPMGIWRYRRGARKCRGLALPAPQQIVSGEPRA